MRSTAFRCGVAFAFPKAASGTQGERREVFCVSRIVVCRGERGLSARASFEARRRPPCRGCGGSRAAEPAASDRSADGSGGGDVHR